MKYFILFATVATITEIVPFSHFYSKHEKNSFNSIMHLINPNCLKIGAKQTKINQERLSQCFYPFAKDPDHSKGVKMQQKLSFWKFTNICLIT